MQPTVGQLMTSHVAPERLSWATGMIGAALCAAPLLPGLLMATLAGHSQLTVLSFQFP